MSRAFRAALVAVAIGATTSPARADQAQAHELARRAERRIAEGDRRGAIDFLEQAFAADSIPSYLLRIGEQWELLAQEERDPADVERARSAYRRGLSQETDPSRLETLRRRLDRLHSEAPQLEPPPTTPAAPSTDAITVRFRTGEEGTTFHVRVGEESCTTPCDLSLHSGLNMVLATGTEDLRLSLFLSESGGTVTLIRSGRRFLLPGAILMAAGGAVAASLWAFTYVCPERLDLIPTPCQLVNQWLWPVLGGAAFFTGAGLLGYARAHRLNQADFHVDDPDASSSSGPGFQLASIGLQPTRGGAATAIGFTF